MNDEQSSALSVPGNEGVLANTSDEVFDALTTPQAMRNFINLGQGQTRECQETGIKPGRFFLSDKDKTRSIPLGQFQRYGSKLQCSLDLVYLAWRPKAVLMVDSKPLLESYNPNHPNFAKILNTQEVKQGQGPKPVAVNTGIECLFFIPEHMCMVDEMVDDSTRGLDEGAIAQVRARIAGGFIGQYFYARRNSSNTVGGPESRGGAKPGTAFNIRSDMQEGKSFTWWEVPVRQMHENQEEGWMVDGRAAATPAIIQDFLNPPEASGESVDGQQDGTTDGVAEPIGR